MSAPQFTPEQLAARRRLAEDFPLYARHALKIRTKAGTIEPLVLNAAQMRFHEAIERQREETGKIRALVLKGRQQGLSTYTGGRFYHETTHRRAARALVMAHHDKAAVSLFAMTHRFHKQCPDLLRPHTKYASRRELWFDALDSSYVVMTAGGEGIGRGDTFQFQHLSEFAFWPASTAEENYNGLRQALSDTDGTVQIIESTANGIGNAYHALWEGATRGENEFLPVFIPWFIQPEYRAPAPADFEPTPDERELIKEFGLDFDQLHWRRLRIGAVGHDLFRQEYPFTPEDAFLTSGRPVFQVDLVWKLLHRDRPAPTPYDLSPSQKWEPDDYGRLDVWEKPRPGGLYTVGADVGMGVRDGDWSVAVVLDERKHLVARYRAQVEPDHFGIVLDRLGRWYNTAHLICESNNHGILTCHVLSKEVHYPNLYVQVRHDERTDIETERVGHYTDVKTKPLVIDTLRGSLRSGELKISDEITLKELLTYIFNDKGKMEAEKGCFDDCVMALALANYAHQRRGAALPIIDDYYDEIDA